MTLGSSGGRMDPKWPPRPSKSQFWLQCWTCLLDFDVTKQQKWRHQQWKNMQQQSTRNSNNQRRMHTKIRQLDDRRAHYKYTRRHTMSTNDDINDNDTFTRGPEASKSHAKHKARWREGRRQLDNRATQKNNRVGKA